MSGWAKVLRIIGSSLSGAADDGSAPIKMGAVFHATPPTLVDGQRGELLLDSRARLAVMLQSATANAIAGVNGGAGDANTGTGSLMTTGLGYVFTGSGWDRLRGALVVKSLAAVSVTAGTPVAIWTPAAGKKFRLLAWCLSVSVAGAVIFKDAATEFARTSLQGAGVGIPSPEVDNFFLSTASNNVLNADVTATGTITGFVCGTEE